MFALRFILLLFLVAFSWSMGKTPSSELNAFGSVVALSFFLAASALYLLPTYEAWRKKHTNLTAIALVNIFLGWSLLGWVVALVWAFKRPESQNKKGEQTTATSSARGHEPAPKKSPSATRACPFCAEEIKIEAIKCKHCGSDIPAPQGEPMWTGM
ncbi:MAG: superinfection immunity protein [Sterolibacterium sp.]|nr:superinfection immunity protein [Sterolibacterium sp.]